MEHSRVGEWVVRSLIPCFVMPLNSFPCRDKLPDAGSPYEGDGGTVDDSVEFVLENFVEANKLWVRMHGQVNGLS